MQQKCPRNLENVEDGVRCVSVDGDADRIVYFFKDKNTSKFVLLDGDKIATLSNFSFYLKNKMIVFCSRIKILIDVRFLSNFLFPYLYNILFF